jgi:transposase-like protein
VTEKRWKPILKQLETIAELGTGGMPIEAIAQRLGVTLDVLSAWIDRLVATRAPDHVPLQPPPPSASRSRQAGEFRPTDSAIARSSTAVALRARCSRDAPAGKLLGAEMKLVLGSTAFRRRVEGHIVPERRAAFAETRPQTSQDGR